MKFTALAFVLFGCIIQTQPQSAYPQQQQTAQASCTDTLQCYGQCGSPENFSCFSTCDSRTSPDSAVAAHAVAQCMAQSGCQDQDCAMQACGAQLQACQNASTPGQGSTGAPPPPPPASGGAPPPPPAY